MRQVRYVVTCSQQTFLLNRLLAAGVPAERIEHVGGEIRFSVNHLYSPVVDQVLGEQDLPYRKSGYVGARGRLRAVLSRPFLLVSVALAITSVILFNSFVFGYTIRGNRLVNTSRVAEVLHSFGADRVVLKRKIDTGKLEKEVSAIEGISFASVRLSGSRLIVEVEESLPLETPDEPRFEPITSLYSAVVTRIVAESGTPVVRSGDRVAVGDLLISPTYFFTEGEAPAPARGEVWGIVTYRKEVILPLYTAESVLTGEVYRTRSVTLFGKRIGGEEAPPFDEYEVSEREVYRGVGVVVREKIYRRRTSATLYHDFDAEAANLRAAALADLLLSVPFYARERGKVVAEQKKLDNVLYIVLYYTVEQRIDPMFTAR